MLETAANITEILKHKLRAEGYTDEPITVPVVAQPDCNPSECWINVPRMIAQHGGTLISGRAIWSHRAGSWYHLEAHAIWQRPDGALIDPTPKEEGDRNITFVSEPLEYTGYLIPSRYILNSKSKRLRRFVELTQAVQDIRATIPAGEKRLMTPAEAEVFGEYQQALLLI